MTRKTYAARGLLEWQMVLNTGGAFIRISFTGGTMGSNGVLPAKYTTDNEALQFLIENSPHFKAGRIIVFNVEKLPDRPSLSSGKTSENSSKKR